MVTPSQICKHLYGLTLKEWAEKKGYDYGYVRIQASRGRRESKCRHTLGRQIIADLIKDRIIVEGEKNGENKRPEALCCPGADRKKAVPD